MSTHLISSFRGGISDESQRGTAGAYKSGRNISIRKFDDTLSCTQKMVKNSGSVVTDLCICAFSASDNRSYWFGNTGKIYGRDLNGTWTLLYTDPDGSISGAAEWNGYVYWATNTKLKKYALANMYSIGTPTEVDVALESGSPHTLKPLLGMLYVANGSFVSSVSLVGTFLAATLELTPDVRVTSFEEYQGQLAIGTRKRDLSCEGFIFLWDTNITDRDRNWDKKAKLPTKGVNAIVEGEKLFAQSGDSIHYVDFTNKLPIFNFPSGSVNPYGVTTYRGMAMFGFAGNTYPGLYAYGRERVGMSHVLTCEYTLSPELAGLTTESIGAVITSGNYILASWKTANNVYGVDIIDLSNKAIGVYESLEFKLPVSMEPSLVNWIKIQMVPMPAGTNIALSVKSNKGPDWTVLSTEAGDSSYSLTNSTEAIFSAAVDHRVQELKVTITPYGNNSPEIIDIESYF